MKKILQKVVITTMTFLLSVTLFSTPVSAAENTVITSDDGKVTVAITSDANSNRKTNEFDVITDEDIVIESLEVVDDVLDFESSDGQSYSYSHAVGENGNYKYSLKYSHAVLIEDENETSREIIREQRLDFEITVDVLESDTATEDDNDSSVEIITEDIEAINDDEQSIQYFFPSTGEVATFSNEEIATYAGNNTVSLGSGISGPNVTVTWLEDPSFFWSTGGGSYPAIYVNGIVGYCMEALIEGVSTGVASSKSIDEINELRVMKGYPQVNRMSSSQKKTLSLIANYGYGFNGQNSDAWKWATQVAIWNELGFSVSGGINVSSEIAIILSNVENHKKLPDFDGSIRKVKRNEQITLTDAELSKFDVSSKYTKGITVISKTGNTLVIKIIQDKAELSLIKKQNIDTGTSMVYTDGESQSVLVSKLKDPVFSFMDFEFKQGDLEITKNNDFYEIMSGVEYEFSTNANMSSPFSTQKTNAQGKILIKDLDEDVVVYYREKATITGHLIDSTIYSLTIKSGETVMATRTNTAIVGSSKLHKTGDGGSKILEGVLFGLFKADGTKISEQLTNASGEITADGLRYGSYYWQELESLPEYWIDTTKHHFSIGDNDHGAVIDVAVANKFIEAKVLVRKIDSETLEPLEGVGFKILDSNNNVVSIKFQQGKNVVEKNEWFTDAEGEFLLEAYLPHGNYTLVETVVLEGYNPIDPIPFTIDKDMNFVELEIIGTVIDLGNIGNTKIYGDILIRKTDKVTGFPLENTVFEIYNARLELVDTVTTNEEGYAELNHQVYGQHHIKEVSVPAPYIIDPETQMQTIFIKEEAVVYEVVFQNDKAAGELEITKRDTKTNIVIAGVEYGLYDITDLLETEGIEVSYEDLKTLNAVQIFETDGKGQVVFKELDISRKYALIELAAPYGYIVSQEVQLIAFDYVNQDTPVIHQSLDLVNERLQVTVKGVKVDSISHSKIISQFFELQLIDMNGNIIPVDHKDEDGTHYWVVDALEFYDFSESKAPIGYIKSDEVIRISTFEEQADHMYVIEFPNDAEPVALPRTGVNASQGLQLGFLVLAVGLFITLLATRKKNKSRKSVPAKTLKGHAGVDIMPNLGNDDHHREINKNRKIEVSDGSDGNNKETNDNNKSGHHNKQE